VQSLWASALGLLGVHLTSCLLLSVCFCFGSSWEVCAPNLFFKICLLWAAPRPHTPFPSRPHFVCKFSRHENNLSVLRPGPPSITLLVLPDFADAYSLTTASYRLIQLSGQIPESSQFLGASKLPLLEWTSLNAGTTMHTYLVSLTPQFMPV
jgi:hypothetical protein